MKLASLVGVSLIGALLAHHGSPWLAFLLGCALLAAVVLSALFGVPEER